VQLIGVVRKASERITRMASNTASPATCGICSELFTDPRILPCLHSFCKKCLQKLYDEHGVNKTLKCPTCEECAPVPGEGVNGIFQDLRRSYEAEVAQYEAKLKSSSDQNCERCIKTDNGPAVCFCCNCCCLLCKTCEEDHQTWRETLNHKLVDVGEAASKGNVLQNIEKKPLLCAVHRRKKLRFFCVTCQKLICRDCKDLKHKDHQYDLIEDVAEKEKKDLLALFDDTEAAKAKMENAMAQGEKTMQCVQSVKKSVDKSIKTTFKKLRDALDSREAALLAKSGEICDGKVKSLSVQHDEQKQIRDKIGYACQMIRTAAQTYSPAEVLSIKRAMKERQRDLLKQFRKCQLEPKENERIHAFLQASPICSAIATFGAVTCGSCPSTTTTDLYIPRMIVGKKRKVIVTARDESGKPFPHGGESVVGEISMAGSTNPPVKAKVADEGNGTYNVSFTPKTTGEHKLAITVSSYPIKGSPFVISARQKRDYTSLFQSCKRSFPASSQPWDVAVDDNGDIFVVDNGYHCISVFSQDGATKLTIGTAGSSGSGNEQFNSPSAIAIQENVIYVADRGNNRIHKISTKGKFISKFGQSGSGNGQFSDPRGICIDPDGKIFVSDCGNNRVCVFSADGTFAYNITGNASDGSNLTNPWGVAFDPSGNLHVVNYGSPCVKVFTPDGKYVTQYGNGQTSSPAGIAIDEEGYSFVADYYNSNSSYNYSYVFVFSPQHQLLTSYQGFRHPAGICFDKEGFLYLADSVNNQVLKY